MGFRHPEFGELTLTYNILAVTAVPGLCLIGYTAMPQSSAEQALQIMGSWSASEQPAADRTHSDRDTPTTAAE
ncbi:MmyB family transcriptional regulator [Mycolicibacterium xanthum]|uniref:MmyB family transcriptional regulator n=1 Tax=Mycolicibacterium xanthum TaxID=2796469 RepID=UPI0027DF7FDB|nr:hypothetical protein [Mycolicibacterium xanthum]